MENGVAARPGGAVSAFVSAIRGTWRGIYDTYRLGGRTMVAAPAIVAIAILPELAQHVVEISLGMFSSMADFRAHSADPLRMGFGYAKVAGLLIAVLLTARFWALGSIRAAISIGATTILRVVLAVALTTIAAFAIEALEARVASPIAILLSIGSILLQAGLTLYAVGALLEDRSMTLAQVFSRYWPTAIVMTILLAAAFGPAQALHMANHKLAIGQPAIIVWGLMAFDGVFVGLFAALLGAALYVGHASGATWQGWGGAGGSLRTSGVASYRQAREAGHAG